MKSVVDLKIVLFSFILMATLSHSSSYIRGNANQDYDSFATTKCLKEPLPAQYGGGIIVERKPVNSSVLPQTIQLKDGLYYVFSAWIQASTEGSEKIITAVFNYSSGVEAGTVVARHGCWSMLKGGIVANVTTPADIIFKAEDALAEIWVENVSLQPFTEEQWRSHQEQRISKLRKRRIRLNIRDANDNATTLGGAKVILKQLKQHFPFGCSMTKNIVNNQAYQSWFSSRFRVTTFKNEMKWYDNEPIQGQENYANPDYMVNFAQTHGISIRGHNVFWEDPRYQPYWVYGLNPNQLAAATDKRINSVMSRYRGKLISWDVVNENLHFRFFDDKLGNGFSGIEYAKARQLDGGATLFMNEYNTVEDGRDPASLPQNYINKLKQIQGSVGGARIGIGLQSHFSQYQPNIVYMRSALDTLGATGMPIWLTEVDVKPNPNQVQYFEQILREGFAHPAVQGIVMWAGPAVDGYNMTLADNKFSNTPAGDLVDRLLKEWRSEVPELKTDDNGLLEVSLFLQMKVCIFMYMYEYYICDWHLKLLHLLLNYIHFKSPRLLLQI
ncbi:GH10 domain-containing protein [Heracleum sosnowskyi]|uniref:GH10 domain-containing protein n=1 Tax=Heracleum sosnowskyi TaxID=360622 RepID=A0AAD8HU55_9APIA|nr:GH10 domain-containing protein [Heracleum sosnowskyi]